MKIFHRRSKAAALALLLSGVAMLADKNAAQAAAIAPNTAGATNTVSSGSTQAGATLGQQMAASPVSPTNIFSGQLTFTNGAFTVSAPVFTVPADKRLVIQFVSAVATVEPSQLLLSATVNGLQTLPQFTGNRLDGSAIFLVSQPLRDVLAPGQSLVVAAERNSSSGDATLFVNVIGQLEDAP